MRFAGGRIFAGFNGNFDTPFNRNSRSGPGTHFQAPGFQGNNQFYERTPTVVRGEKNQENQVGSYRAQVAPERNQPERVRLMG